MSDHRIIIEASGFSGSADPTSPDLSKTATEPNKEKVIPTISVQSVISVAKNPIGSLLGKVAKAVPWVAAAIVVATVVVHVADTAMDFNTIKTGDYNLQMEWGNMKTAMGHIMNPIGYAVSVARQQAEADVFNKTQAYNRELMGNADVNTFGKRGA